MEDKTKEIQRIMGRFNHWVVFKSPTAMVGFLVGCLTGMACFACAISLGGNGARSRIVARESLAICKAHVGQLGMKDPSSRIWEHWPKGEVFTCWVHFTNPLEGELKEPHLSNDQAIFKCTWDGSCEWFIDPRPKGF